MPHITSTPTAACKSQATGINWSPLKDFGNASASATSEAPMERFTKGLHKVILTMYDIRHCLGMIEHALDGLTLASGATQASAMPSKAQRAETWGEFHKSHEALSSPEVHASMVAALNRFANDDLAETVRSMLFASIGDEVALNCCWLGSPQRRPLTTIS